MTIVSHLAVPIAFVALAALASSGSACSSALPQPRADAGPSGRGGGDGGDHLEDTGTDTDGAVSADAGGNDAPPDAGSSSDGAVSDGAAVDGDGASCPPPEVRTVNGTPYSVIAGCQAPPSANGLWIAEAGWGVSDIRDFTLSGDRLVLDTLQGFDARRGATGWTIQPIIAFSDPIVRWAAVDGSTLAYQTQFFVDYRIVIGGWSAADSATKHALSGDTLVTTDRVFVNAAGSWGPSATIARPDDTGAGAEVVALGFDRFALLGAAETRIVRRQDDAWVDLGALPAATSVAMAPATTEGSWLVLSAKDKEAATGAYPVSFYTLARTGWLKQPIMLAPRQDADGFGSQVAVSQPNSDALGDIGFVVVSGGPTTLIVLRDSMGVMNEHDRIPIRGRARASGRNLAIFPRAAGDTAPLGSPGFVYRYSPTLASGAR